MKNPETGGPVGLRRGDSPVVEPESLLSSKAHTTLRHTQ